MQKTQQIALFLFFLCFAVGSAMAQSGLSCMAGDPSPNCIVPPGPPIPPLVCHDLVVTSLAGGSARGDQGYGYQFTNSNGYKPLGSSAGVAKDHWFGVGTLGTQGKHILFELWNAHNQYYPTDHARVHIDLGPDFVFEDDGSRAMTADLDSHHPIKRYINVVSADCPAAIAIWKAWQSQPKQSPSISAAPKLSGSVACPQLPVIRKDVIDINQLASRLERDDSYYQSAVADMLAGGYNSGFARLAFGSDEGEIVQDFATPEKIQAIKPAFVNAIRSTADIRQQLATAMYAYSQGQHYQAPPNFDAIDDSIAGYFCSADPAKMNVASWNVLYHAGYIAYPLYKDVKAKMESNAILGPIVLAANVVDVAPLGVAVLRYAGREFVVNAGELGALKTLAGRSLALEPPRALSTIEQRLTGRELNELRFKGYHPPFKEDAAAYRASTNVSTQLVRFYSEEVDNQFRSWLVRKELVIDGEGNFLPAREIQSRLAMQHPPTHVCDVTVPENTSFWVGTAAPQPQWGGIGETEQFYIDPVDLPRLKFSKGEPLAK